MFIQGAIDFASRVLMDRFSLGLNPNHILFPRFYFLSCIEDIQDCLEQQIHVLILCTLQVLNRGIGLQAAEYVQPSRPVS